MTKPHWSMLCEPPKAVLGLWDLRLIQAWNPVWDKEHKTMNTKLGYQKRDWRFQALFIPFSLSAVYQKCVYATAACLQLHSPPPHPRTGISSQTPPGCIQVRQVRGAWGSLSFLSHFGRSVSGQYICVSVSAQTRLSWNLLVTCTRGRPPSWTVRSHRAKPPLPQRAHVFRRPGSPYCWRKGLGEGKRLPGQVGVLAENKSLLGVSGFFPCPHHPRSFWMFAQP